MGPGLTSRTCYFCTSVYEFNALLYPATLKSAGYYVIPSIQKIASSIHPSVRRSVCQSVRPSAHRFHSLLGAFFN